VANRHFVSFAGGRKCFRGALKRLAREIKEFDSSAVFWCFDETTLDDDIPGLDQSFSSFANSNPRGFGLWVWKPWIILKTLSEVPDGDIVFYVDAGTTVHTSKKSRRRYQHYLEHINQHQHLFFQQKFIEINWTKAAVISRFRLGKSDLESGQVLGGIHGHLSDPLSRTLISEWLALCTSKSGELLKDAENKYFEDSRCVEHRHDASVLSCLVKSKRIAVIPDETFFHPRWNRSGANYPFWATRKCSQIPSWMGYYAPKSWPHVIKSRLTRRSVTELLNFSSIDDQRE
jgi:hypothetical protein